jgi:hypothetical protein
MQVEDGEDGASAGRGEGGADAPAARAHPSEHAAAPARPATADAIKEKRFSRTIVFCVWSGSHS